VTYKELASKVRDLTGADDRRASEAILLVAKEFGLEPEMDYAKCIHTSSRMMEHYAKTGVCGICAHEANRALTVEVGRLKNELRVGTPVGIGTAALISQALASRYAAVIKTHAKCQDCGAPLMGTRRPGCDTCREDRAWLAKQVKPAAKRRSS
jgi:hypothetical protein